MKVKNKYLRTNVLVQETGPRPAIRYLIGRQPDACPGPKSIRGRGQSCPACLLLFFRNNGGPFSGYTCPEDVPLEAGNTERSERDRAEAVTRRELRSLPPG
ncbi:hypothetical protein GWI33_011567 [Rhynchophorus ferrugineus]|uniref:Uncharacterized protein n=1 Tax=Rhynchophorus ferrugineus TaxID=354439 RepID=A0A834ISJ3_RHYFE|nr:hypothetical protein GWI33_011567 [Rhynchophorus ferrugineus]